MIVMQKLAVYASLNHKNKKVAVKFSAFYRILAVTIVATIVLTIVAGCKKNWPGEASSYSSDGCSYSINGQPEFSYIADTISFPEGIGDISNVVYQNGKLHFVATIIDYGDVEYFHTISSDSVGIYSMSVDGTNITRLESYVLPVKIPADAFGEVNICEMNIDREGNLWVAEQWNFYNYDLPENFDKDLDSVWEYHNSIDSGIAIRKLDNTGEELLSVDMGILSERQENFIINSLITDDYGNIYISVNNGETNGAAIYVIDSNSRMQFRLDIDNQFEQFLKMSDGFIAFISNPNDATTEDSRIFQKIDYSASTLGDIVNLPNLDGAIHLGSGGYDFFISDNSNLYAVSVEEQKAAKLLNFLDCNVFFDYGIRSVAILPEESIICVRNIWDNATSRQKCDLLVFTKILHTEQRELSILTLATFHIDNILSNAVARFNSINTDYRIEVVDYSQFNTEDDNRAGLMRLTTELISGKCPDIMSVTMMPYMEYAEKGLFTDLYPFIDSDVEFVRSDFINSIFRAAETNGRLCVVFSSFTINTIIGHPSVVGSGMGWTMEEFNDIVANLPITSTPLGQGYNKMSFLQTAISYGGDDYINWETGTVSFDSPGFIQLLQLADTFPPEDGYEYIASDEAIATGHQFMLPLSLQDFSSFQHNKALFGGEIVFKGFPTENNNGHSITANNCFAITENSPNKEAAWTFVRMFLDKDWQLDNAYGVDFLTNQAAFNQRIDDSLNNHNRPNEHPVMFEYDGGFKIDNLTQVDVDQILALVNSASGMAVWRIDDAIWGIVSESALDYFNGKSSAQEAARIIQSRMTILVSERS